MVGLPLSGKTGFAYVDEILGRIVEVFELRFPARIRGYYLEGSYADGTPVSTSDIDMEVVFKDRLAEGEPERFARTIDECHSFCLGSLDITYTDEFTLFVHGSVRLQLATRLIYGEDIRPSVPLMPPAAAVRRNMHAPYHTYSRLRGSPATLLYPLGYPDPSSAFYGYEHRRMRTLEGMASEGTKDLVGSILRTATALAGLRSACYVVTKRDCIAQYGLWVNDAWTDLVEAAYKLCRNRWGYTVPQGRHQRATLRRICERALAFENFFLAIYRDYLLADLAGADYAARLFASRRLGQLLYPETGVVEALQHAQRQGDAELEQAATAALQRYAAIAGAWREAGSGIDFA